MRPEAAPPPPPPDRVFTLREADAADADAIDTLTRDAFRGHAFSQQTEHLIVRRLRAAAALRLSLVAVQDGLLLGHAAFSTVCIDGADTGWCGLGPLAVAPAHQRQGIGRALVRSGLRRLAAQGAAGCMVLGDPGYYRPLGFAPCPGLQPAGVPPELFLALPFGGEVPRGGVNYHPAFEMPHAA